MVIAYFQNFRMIYSWMQLVLTATYAVIFLQSHFRSKKLQKRNSRLFLKIFGRAFLLVYDSCKGINEKRHNLPSSKTAER